MPQGLTGGGVPESIVPQLFRMIREEMIIMPIPNARLNKLRENETANPIRPITSGFELFTPLAESVTMMAAAAPRMPDQSAIC